MAKYNASAVMLSVWDGSPTPVKKLIAEQTKATLQFGTETIDVTSKQNDRWKDLLGGIQSGTLNLEFFDEPGAETTEVSTAKLFEIWSASSRPKWTLSSSIIGTLSFDFYALITALDLNRDMETGAAGTMTLEIVARPTTTVVAS